MATSKIIRILLASTFLLASSFGIVEASLWQELSGERRLTDYCRSASDADVVEGLCDTVRMTAVGFRG